MSELMHLSYEEQFVTEWVVASWRSIQHTAQRHTEEYSIQRNGWVHGGAAYRGGDDRHCLIFAAVCRQ